MRHTHERESLVDGRGMPVDYVPNSHRVVRVSPDFWERMLRFQPKGIAPGTEHTSDGTPTVLCTYADGTSEIRTVSSIRRTRETRNTAPREVKGRTLTEAEKYLPSAVEILGAYS